MVAAVIAGLLRLLLTTAAKYAAMRAVSLLRYFESAVGLHRRAVEPRACKCVIYMATKELGLWLLWSEVGRGGLLPLQEASFAILARMRQVDGFVVFPSIFICR